MSLRGACDVVILIDLASALINEIAAILRYHSGGQATPNRMAGRRINTFARNDNTIEELACDDTIYEFSPANHASYSMHQVIIGIA